MIRIAIVTSRLTTGGLTRVIFNLARFIDKDNFDLKVFLFGFENQSSDLNHFIDNGIAIETSGILPNDSMYSRIIKTRKALDKFNPSIVHLHTLDATFIGGLFFRKHKLLATLHGNLIHNYTDTFGLVKGYFYSFIHYLSLELVDFKSLVSRNLLKVILSKRNAFIVHNGIDVETFKPASIEEKNELRKQLGFLQNDSIFISLGSLSHRKNPSFILKAFLNCNDLQNALLIFIGYGELEPSLKELSKNDQRVIFLGQLSNPEKYLKIGDYFISASFSEGLPNAVIEAISCGLVPILSDIPPHQEIVEITKVNHAFFDPRNITSLKTILHNLPNHNQITPQIDLSAQNMVRNYEVLYDTIFNNRK